MKKTILMSMAFVLVSSGLNARDISEKRNLVGFNAGFSFNTMGLQKDSRFEDSKNSVKPGGVFGINFEHRAAKVFAIELGVNYANRGTQQKLEGANLNRSFYRLNFHSLEVPLIAKFYMGKNKIFNINVGGFASYAVNVQSRTKIDLKDNTLFQDTDERENNLLRNHNDEDIDGQRPLRAFDAGVNVGFEFVSKSGFGAGARIQQGLVDFTNPKFIVPLDDKKVYHTNGIVYALFKI